jgi:hypothetical protein
VFGLITSIVIRIIIKRHHQWAAWYVNKYELLPGNHGIVYPVSTHPFVATEISQVDAGDIGKTLVAFCNTLAIIWFFAMVVFLLFP